ncbi:MAG: RecQ family ATP-dependent DNA helicase [Bifidobacterium scardovii]|uniref:RecQ family ATP-dependent DNA helicase n=1 Tax=Bifidobacterium scardovii TaxID=158787 RepID=UPI0006650C02|nr:RecQ family ATP-dependent DNA helicase [Bifidobacterium scardovii]MBS6948886.1 RecQ family ATP-dependent DNA helicase [Bifidobacterium scardovii]MDU3737497.1 RecQ family ATP-dependent DNA helicase [Bifidobacterium scardovii]MDU5612082.1 RecQ family ATP-dependent DNA helicase [Bifidobacterium scardovii]MDU6283170.1 RecQ family ATP-dependent DNA helicase [Bifidobacterium scardovii]
MTANEAALGALKQYFGYDSFRPGQSGLVDAILAGRDALGVMPTGAGKSVCYQIPAMLLPGVTVVISPLISLMRDQVDGLNDAGIPAAFINTTQAGDEQGMVLAQAAAGDVKLLYVAPERLETERFRNFASRVSISLIAVDEAHCVSQWGQDFRSSYLGIGEFIAGLPSRPIVAAFTATATERVRRDIVSMLGLNNPQITVTGFDRDNLYFDVIRMETKRKASWVAQYVAEHADESGIVYCATRKETEALAASLNHAVPMLRGAGAGAGASDAAGGSVAGAASAMPNGPVAVAYHGGMSPDVRERAQRDFVTDRVPVVVATNAFGMGIDKSNVRYVIHHNMPESIEAYYQEAGRAGRDGEPSRCTLLWNESDIVTRRRLLDNDYENERLTPQEQEIVRMSKRRLLDGMIGYCRTTECLHTYMTRYFGETTPCTTDGGKCAGGCTNCVSTFETIDVTDIARAISRCVHDVMYDFDEQGRPTRMPVRQGLGSGKIVAILRGSRAQDLLSRGFDRCPSYGQLKDTPEARVRDVLSQMATDGFLFISEGRLPIVGFGTRAAQTVAPDFHYEIKRIERKRESGSRARGLASASAAGDSGVAFGAYVPDDDEEALFQRLRELRRDIAQEIGKPPYIVFSDRTLRDMARIRPVTDAQFLAVNGVGESKLRQYGRRFMEAVAAFGAA